MDIARRKHTLSPTSRVGKLVLKYKVLLVASEVLLVVRWCALRDYNSEALVWNVLKLDYNVVEDWELKE